MAYPKSEYVVGSTSSVLKPKRLSNKLIEHPRAQPGNIILVHGVNDVGAGFSLAEEGLCAGLEQRLFRHFKAASYSSPSTGKKADVEPDPDAKYFKRKVEPDTDSPVIPFYWGFREVLSKAGIMNGQFTDRHGNRLDKDLSKGGGPFANATSTLPDMWNRGAGAPLDPIGDPLRPLKYAPGRMYMVLAACRLAALISMIRNYQAKDTVTIVAHSQGCLLSLLAQALLMEKGERTADTLILTHPPYSLDEQVSVLVKTMRFSAGGEDAPMQPFYDQISNLQSMSARLQTLVNIVRGVAKAKATEPAFNAISERASDGMVESRWQPDTDRDNRGKVYLYFCPEDMTVSLDNVRGIGWQGVPEFIKGSQGGYTVGKHKFGRGSDVDIVRRWEWRSPDATRMPLEELGGSFRQRVFTAKQRMDLRLERVMPVLVGQAPHDFPLRVIGEDDHSHVAKSGRGFREHLPESRWPPDPYTKPEQQRHGIRRITGEALRTPCKADLHSNQIEPDNIPASSRLARVKSADRGPCEEVDPITAAIAVTSNSGFDSWVEERPDPFGQRRYSASERGQPLSDGQLTHMTLAYNKERQPDKEHADDQFKVVSAILTPDGKVMARIQESPNQARRRWQHEVSAKSFHSVIFASRDNHRNVTAYDVAIGSGEASSDPKFYAYLCAVADWRLKNPPKVEIARPGMLHWVDFLTLHGAYLKCEPKWRRELIEGNVDYYTTGVLPACLPVLTGPLWDIVISETMLGARVNRPAEPKEKP